MARPAWTADVSIINRDLVITLVPRAAAKCPPRMARKQKGKGKAKPKPKGY